MQLMYCTCLDVLYALYNYISPRRCSPLYVWLACRGPILRNASNSTFLPFNATLYSRMLLHELRVSSTKHSILRTARSIVLLNDGAEYEDNGNLQRLLNMRQQGSTSSTLNNHKSIRYIRLRFACHFMRSISCKQPVQRPSYVLVANIDI